MTPGEYKNGGESLVITYQFTKSTFGEILIASTPKGICHLAFTESKTEALEKLRTEFPKAQYKQMNNAIIQKALSLFQNLPEQIESKNLEVIKLHLKGSEFQLKVWQALLTIPQGELSTYGNLAQKISNPKASRAVGTAIGSNPIAYLIPCHRVIQSSGKTGGYRWNPIRKKAMLAWEAAINSEL
jgi:AraC family transcriptional regulator of adaptative response/methylated-DNA-[protein]-cysteine methyltransferase